VAARLLGAGKLLEFVQTAAAPARQERQETKIAGLQTFLRIEEVFQEFFVPVDQLFVAVQSSAGLVAELFELISDTLFGASDGSLNGGINLGNGLVQFVDALLNVAKVGIEFAGKFFGNCGVVHAIAKGLGATPYIFDFESVLLKQPYSFGIDQREVGSREKHGHAAKKLFVQHLRLGEIGDFGRAAKVGDCGQQEVLQDRTQQRVGAEFFRRENSPFPAVITRRFPSSKENRRVLCAVTLTCTS